MGNNEFLAPVPSASDYTVSADLWQRLEAEIQSVSARIEGGDELTPDDVKNVKALRNQVESYVTDFGRAMKSAEAEYKRMVNQRLNDLGYNVIEEFTAKKRQEQKSLENGRITAKMENLKTIVDGLLARTSKLKDLPMSKELLPAFTARFPNVQSGAKSKDINDWKPYFAVIQRVLNIMDTFFCDPKYEDAALLPLHSGTIRELLSYARDGKEEHIANVVARFREDQTIIETEKLKQELKTKADGIEHIQNILEEMGDLSGLSEGARKIRTEQAWEDIALIVRLVNTL